MNDSTLLHRQINPKFIQPNPLSAQPRVTSQAFRPFGNARMLSTYDGDQISAADSWLHYTSELALESCGVMSVTQAECAQTKLECAQTKLQVIPDGVPYPEHVSISFTGLTPGQIKSVSKILTLAANARGWQYRP